MCLSVVRRPARSTRHFRRCRQESYRQLEMGTCSKGIQRVLQFTHLFQVRQLFRDHQKENLEVATYKLLRNIEKNLRRIDIPTADFDFADENINLSLWLRVQLPIPLPNPRRPPK